MKTTLVIGIVLLFMLMWAAVHDIINGAENLTNEYIAVILSAVLLPVLIYILVKKISEGKKMIKVN